MAASRSFGKTAGASSAGDGRKAGTVTETDRPARSSRPGYEWHTRAPARTKTDRKARKGLYVNSAEKTWHKFSLDDAPFEFNGAS
jgi:hypothetical protein